MPERFQWQSALASFGLEARARERVEDAGVYLCERRVATQLAIRGDAGNDDLGAAVEAILGLGLPVAPKTARRKPGRALLWLGPDEWLAVLDVDDATLIARFDESLSDMRHAVVDVSHSRSVIGIRGANATETLMKGTNVDLHPRVFGPDSCIQAHLARCHMLLHRLDEDSGYDIYVHRSFAVYAWQWLCDAAREYGVAVE